MASIKDIRRKVDGLDRRIADLLVARLRLLETLVPLKTLPRDRRRERDVLSRVSSRAGRGRSPLAGEAAFLKAVYREIIRQCLARQKSGHSLRALASGKTPRHKG